MYNRIKMEQIKKSLLKQGVVNRWLETNVVVDILLYIGGDGQVELYR